MKTAFLVIVTIMMAVTVGCGSDATCSSECGLGIHVFFLLVATPVLVCDITMTMDD